MDRLFEDYDSWRCRQGDLESEMAKDVDGFMECEECLGASAHSNKVRCRKCDGKGYVRDEEGIGSAWEIEGKLRREYERQLERDYRNALHLFGAA